MRRGNHWTQGKETGERKLEGVMGKRPVLPHTPGFWSLEFTWVGSQKVSLQVFLQ